MKNKIFSGNKRYSESRFSKNGYLTHQNKLDKNWFNDNNRFSNSSKLEDLWFKINDFSMLNALLKSGFDINARNEYGYTALFDADIKKSKYLISKGIDINAIGKSDINALFTAKSNEKMHLLIDEGVDIHQKDKRGANILLKMVIDKNAEMFMCLLEKGVSSKFYFLRLFWGILEKETEFNSFLKDYHEPFYKLLLSFQEKSEIKNSINSILKDDVSQNSKRRL